MKAALLPDRGVVKVAGDGARNFLHGLVTADILDLTAGPGAVLRAADAAGQNHRRFHRRRGAGAGRRRLFSRYSAGARRSAGRKAQSLQAARQGHRRGSVGKSRRARGLGRQRARRAPTNGARPVLRRSAAAGARPARDAAAASCRRRRPPSLGAEIVDAERLRGPPHRARHPARRSSISATATPFPHETDMDQLGGVDFARAAMSARKWCRAWSTAAPRAPAPCRSATTAPRRKPASPSSPASASSASWARPPPAAASHCCASTGWRRRCRAASRSWPAACRSIWSNPDWARFPFPGETKAAE